MKFLKDREKPGQRQSSPNIRFSQAWRMFKTGELAGNEFMAGMRGSPVRDNWSGEEVNRKVNERNAAEGRTEPDESRLNDIMGGRATSTPAYSRRWSIFSAQCISARARGVEHARGVRQRRIGLCTGHRNCRWSRSEKAGQRTVRTGRA